MLDSIQSTFRKVDTPGANLLACHRRAKMESAVVACSATSE